ncbi:hypothetical protein [Propionimicrobium lymphophilum]|uniref:hypothetical protein n=1 Tax=Propionimicrobium lymphophilum TaxID=33012 RepID=UPI0023F4F231|nr:hypothetical protein [Propionimicrobium lymphophilum]
MSSVETTPKGWPLLKDSSYIADIPEYTERLASKLDKGDADVAAAINAASQADSAAAKALTSASNVTQMLSTLGDLADLRIAAGLTKIEFGQDKYFWLTIKYPEGRFTKAPALALLPTFTNSWHLVQSFTYALNGAGSKDEQNVFGYAPNAFNGAKFDARWLAIETGD